MGYVPSTVARSLVTGQTRTIGLVVTTVIDLFFAEIISAVEEAALERGYSLLLANSGGDTRREMAAIQGLQERRVDGIIVTSGHTARKDLAEPKGILAPLVIVSSIHERHLGYSVTSDNRGGGRQATGHLMDLGHRRIGHIAGRAGEWDSVDRQRGYEEALRAGGLAVDPALIVHGTGHPEGGMEAVYRLFALEERPTALFCYNDATALGAMRAARAAGVQVPRELSVVGFDDISLARFAEPPLTTVAQSIRRMGETAVHMVLNLAADAGPVANCLLPVELTVRESTAPPTGRGGSRVE
jgi:DNA-binding LacI/PurR family transcriptional regulator